MDPLERARGRLAELAEAGRGAWDAADAEAVLARLGEAPEADSGPPLLGAPGSRRAGPRHAGELEAALAPGGCAARVRYHAAWLRWLLDPDDPRALVVSVVIPVYNAAELVVDAVRSALAQTWPGIEVVVVDDGSEDDPAAALAPLAPGPGEPRRLRVVGRPNGGAAAARNTGIHEATGVFVHFLDADDVLDPEAVARQIAAFRAVPEAELCCARFRAEGARGREVPPGHKVPPLGDAWCPTRDLLATWTRRYPFHTSSVLAPAWLLEEVGPWDEDLSVPGSDVSDAGYWLRLGLRGTRVIAVDEPLYTRRFWPGSLTTAESPIGPILFLRALLALLERPERAAYVAPLLERMRGRGRWEVIHDDPTPPLPELREALLRRVEALGSAPAGDAAAARRALAALAVEVPAGDGLGGRLAEAVGRARSRIAATGPAGGEPGIDVVVVPDFGGSARALFTIRTLLFLGSWLEHEGASRGWPLHVAAVGEVPDAVADLAARCGARLSLHPALECGGERFLNKLRGLEVESASGRILLLDADTLVLGDLAALDDLGACLSALVCPGNRVPLEVFAEIFELAGVPLPEERVLPLIGQLEERLPPGAMRDDFRRPIPPYFNSGVLLAPADGRLRAEWERLQRLLHEHYGGRTDVYKHLGRGDQYSLSIATALLGEQGVPFKPLPYPFHGLDVLYAAGALRYADTGIYHAKTLFRRAPKDGSLDPLLEVERYREDQLGRLYPESRLSRLGRRLRRAPHPAAADSLVRLCDRIAELTRRYVLPTL